MKHIFLAGILAAALATAANAQPPAPAGPPPPVEGRELPGLPPPAPLQPIVTITGSVVRLTANDDYVYDGFIMLNSQDSLAVHFPPHLGQAVTALARPGSQVAVSGTVNTSPLGQREVGMLSLSAGGRTVADTLAPLTQPAARAQQVVSGRAAVSDFQRDMGGRAIGLILSNNSILRLRPGAAEQLGAYLSKGAEVGYTGVQDAPEQSVANVGNYTVVRCTTITVNGQQYLL